MPYGLTPKINSDYPQNFVLLDKDGFELTGSGFRHRQSSFKIKNFLAYGYNDSSIVVKCTDSLNNIRYLTSYKIGYNKEERNPEISFKDLSNADYEQVKDKYQWFELDEETYNTIGWYKFLSMLGILLSLILIIYQFFIRR